MPEDSEQTREFVHQLTSHQAALRAFILSQMPGLPGVGDVLQEVNLLLWEKKSSFEPGSNFRAWAFAVARYKIMEHRRHLKRDGWLMFDDEMAAELAEEVSDNAERTERYLEALEGCLSKLDPEERELVQKRYGSEGTVREYAEQTGRTPGALRIALHRIRMLLRDCVISRLGPDASLPAR